MGPLSHILQRLGLVRNQNDGLPWMTPELRKQARSVRPGRFEWSRQRPLKGIALFIAALDISYIIKLPNSASKDCCPFWACQWYSNGQPLTPLEYDPWSYYPQQSPGTRTWYVELTIDRDCFPTDPALWPRFTIRAAALMKNAKEGRDRCFITVQSFLDLPPDVHVDGRDVFNFTLNEDGDCQEGVDIPIGCLFRSTTPCCALSIDGVIEAADLACVFYIRFQDKASFAADSRMSGEPSH